MVILDDRRNAFENKFAHNEKMRFKAMVRRNRLLGLWAAELLGKSGEAAGEYAAEVVAADFQSPGDDDVVEKLRADFDAGGVKISESDIREKLLELLPIAAAEFEKN